VRGRRALRTLIVMVSALAFSVVGLLWTRVTEQWGGGTYCEGPPPLPNRRGGTSCIYFSPSWGWAVLWMALGAILGYVLAIAGLRLYRLRGNAPSIVPYRREDCSYQRGSTAHAGRPNTA
jgi:hypothetical protein